MLTIEQVAQAMEIPLVPITSKNWSAKCLEPDMVSSFLGFPATPDAALTRSGKVLYKSNDEPTAWESTLHEVMHAVAGPDSFSNEDAIMALQWHIIQELEPNQRNMCRDLFAEYGLMWEIPERRLSKVEIGNTNDFLKSRAWNLCVECAVRQGLLTRDFRVIWGLGFHPEWKQRHA